MLLLLGFAAVLPEERRERGLSRWLGIWKCSAEQILNIVCLISSLTYLEVISKGLSFTHISHSPDRISGAPISVPALFP